MARRRRRGGFWEKPKESEKKRVLDKWRKLIPKILSNRKRRGKGKIPFGSLALISGMMGLLQH